MDKKILVIDDEKNMRKLLKLELGDQGYEVISAETASDGLQILKHTIVDLVVLDIKMPGMDGIEALEKIVSIHRALPVVMHSAYSHYKENYLTWSAVAYVVKSWDFSELTQTIAKILNKTEP